jgi:hypothetical protein
MKFLSLKEWTEGIDRDDVLVFNGKAYLKNNIKKKKKKRKEKKRMVKL